MDLNTYKIVAFPNLLVQHFITLLAIKLSVFIFSQTLLINFCSSKKSHCFTVGGVSQTKTMSSKPWLT
jgi:hypothetical protein